MKSQHRTTILVAGLYAATFTGCGSDSKATPGAPAQMGSNAAGSSATTPTAATSAGATASGTRSEAAGSGSQPGVDAGEAPPMSPAANGGDSKTESDAQPVAGGAG